MPIDRRPRFALSDRWLQASVAVDAAGRLPLALRQWAAGRPECAGMVAARRHEYLLARWCAAELLAACGAGESVFPGTRGDRSPDWPPGFAGSVTHTRSLVAVALGRGGAVGIDVEDLLGERDLAYVVTDCLTADEQARAQGLPAAERAALATVLFSAKEAFFKCLYPAVGRFFDFVDAQATRVDPVRAGREGSVGLRLLTRLADGFEVGYELTGSFRFDGRRVFTAFER